MEAPPNDLAPSPPGARRYLAIALVSCAVLLFEVLVTRLLSVVLFYHFVFLSVSLAMLGLGAPGVWYSLRPPGPRALTRSLLVAGALLPISVLAMVRLGPAFRGVTWFWILCLLAPVLAMGSAVCILLLEARGRAVATMYAADLLGATIGAALTLPLMRGLPIPPLVAGLGLLPLVAAGLLERRARLAGLALAVLLSGSLFVAKLWALRFNKSYLETQVLYEKWTPTARITVIQPSLQTGAFWGASAASRKSTAAPEHLWLDQDGSAGTPILRFDPKAPPPMFLLHDVTSIAYQLRKAEWACIIGAGGGRDILTAWSTGVPHVDAVELNPFTVDVVSRVFRDFSGDPYHLPGVNAVVDEGRSFLTRTPHRYDVLQISLIDSFSATAAGAFALSENSLYTIEAFRLYWNRLAPTGLLSITRWMIGTNRLETARVAQLARAALAEEGVEEPRQHLLIVQGGTVGSVIVSKAALGRETIERVDAISAQEGFVRHWPLGPTTPADSLVAGVLLHGPDAATRAGFDLSPPTDDRPFFFQTVDILRTPARQYLGALSEGGVFYLRRLLAIVAGLSVLVFFLPFAFGRRFARSEGFGRGTVFFASIGLGFMFVELPLINRFSVYLGHPSFATVIVLGTMLVAAGCGSFLVSRVSVAGAKRAVLLLPLVVLATVLGLELVFTHTIGFSLAGRMIVGAAYVAPAGVLMGFAFPSGMSELGERNRTWFWAVNGAMSVLASVFALALAMAAGFTTVLLLAVVCYLVAALMLFGAGKRPSSPATTS